MMITFFWSRRQERISVNVLNVGSLWSAQILSIIQRGDLLGQIKIYAASGNAFVSRVVFPILRLPFTTKRKFLDCNFLINANSCPLPIKDMFFIHYVSNTY